MPAESAGPEPDPAPSVDRGDTRTNDLAELHARLTRLERRPAPPAGTSGPDVLPAWRRVTAGEKRLPGALATAAAIGLQIALPDRLNLASRFFLPAVEAVMLVLLVTFNPDRVDRVSRPLRALALALIAIASLANAYSATQLVVGLVDGSLGGSAGPLLSTGAAIYLTNVLVFALWYWEFDRGGPAARAAATHTHPDFLFPQMATLDVADPNWEPGFADYLYVSFTNATAFSPTDTMPLTRWAKLIMLLQSAVSLVTVALVIARAVNILK